MHAIFFFAEYIAPIVFVASHSHQTWIFPDENEEIKTRKSLRILKIKSKDWTIKRKIYEK